MAKMTNDEMLKELANRTPKSGELWKKAQDLVPGGLLSQARKFKPYPFYADHAEGAYIWDIDNNRYIDCTMSFGVHVLGHCPPTVVDAMVDQAKRGTSYGTPHKHEIEFTKRFVDCVPCAEMAMLCNSGTEATMIGIRMMRASTKKPLIAKFEGTYHGWHDYAQWSVYVDPEQMGPEDKPNQVACSGGIPDAVKGTVLMLPFNEKAFEMIEEHADQLAGVMIEPVLGGGAFPAGKEFLEKLREVTERTGVLLMFDEVITGFRIALGGGQEKFGVMPDLATYGKIIGGGAPIGAVAVSQKLMDDMAEAEELVSSAGTFSGNPFTLAAGAETLKYLMENKNVYADMDAKGDRLRNGFNDWAKSKGYEFCLTGMGSMFQLHQKAAPISRPRQALNQDSDIMGDLQLHLRMNKVYIPWFHLAFFSVAHTDKDLETVLSVLKDSVEAIMNK
ncbi:MAG: aspartate aminotransferase family protein [Desulfobacterales bacterium]|nr:aspartate aminotransferase family protein [Desulfobacterales bacterium]